MSKHRLPLVAAVYLGSFVALLDVSIVNVALPTIQQALQTDFGGLQWVVDAYTLCLSAFMLSSGLIGDRYGRKRSWLAGVGIFVAGSLICAVAPNLPVLLAGRVVQGIAGSLLIPGALSILTRPFPMRASAPASLAAGRRSLPSLCSLVPSSVASWSRPSAGKASS
ncbi:MFS transporter [Mesorhizobium sp. M0239]|uniref:MFS transporter n=1 Tax=Mesorhizobium sp. M0239 TaxID=2956924 RepID=UPI003338A4B7